MFIVVWLFIMLFCYVLKNTGIKEGTRMVCLGGIGFIGVLYIIFGIAF